MSKSGGVLQFVGGRMTSRGQCQRNPVSAPDTYHESYNSYMNLPIRKDLGYRPTSIVFTHPPPPPPARAKPLI